MPGTLFLDALKKKQRLDKGYPLVSGETLPDTKSWFESDRNLYKVPSIGRRIVNRLMAPIKAADAKAEPRYQQIRDQLEAEKAEGVTPSNPFRQKDAK